MLYLYRGEVALNQGTFNAQTSKPTGWTHAVLNYLGPDAGQGVRLFLNGVQVAADANQEPLGYTRAIGSGSINIGRGLAGYNDFYMGVQVDEVVYFNEALSNSDIQKLYMGF